MNRLIIQPLVTIDNISKSYRDQRALHNISLTIAEGEVLAILGPNGAGKTTLINLLLGRLSQDTGLIKILGNSPGVHEVKRQCGAMLQVAGIPDTLKVKEHIALFRSYYPAPMDCRKIIELTGLGDIENQYSKTLSAGQKQRLLFALSICGNPKLLFLDEPSVGMDIEARKLLERAIEELKEQGTSIVLTTHYLEDADRLADHIVLINQGRIIQEGTPQQIKATVKSKKICLTAKLVSEDLQKLPGVTQVRVTGLHCEIYSSDAIATLKRLFSLDKTITDLSVTGASLEDAFLQLNSRFETESITTQATK